MGIPPGLFLVPAGFREAFFETFKGVSGVDFLFGSLFSFGVVMAAVAFLFFLIRGDVVAVARGDEARVVGVDGLVMGMVVEILELHAHVDGKRRKGFEEVFGDDCLKSLVAVRGVNDH